MRNRAPANLVNKQLVALGESGNAGPEVHTPFHDIRQHRGSHGMEQPIGPQTLAASLSGRSMGTSH
jgi:hypothetical protein